MDNVKLESCLGKSEASEAVRYEKVFLERHEKDLNVTLAIAILFSVVGVAIALGTRPELTDIQTTPLAISLAINYSAAPGETIVVPVQVVSHVKGAPPEDVANAISAFYASSLFSLVTVILVMITKESPSNYHPEEEVPVIDPSESRQGKFDTAYRLACCGVAKGTRMVLRIALVYLMLGFCYRLCPTHTTIVCYLSILLMVVPGCVGIVWTIIDFVRAVW